MCRLFFVAVVTLSSFSGCASIEEQKRDAVDRAHNLKSAGDYKNAVLAYDEAIRLGETDPSIFEARAAAKEASGDSRGAEKDRSIADRKRKAEREEEDRRAKWRSRIREDLVRQCGPAGPGPFDLETMVNLLSGMSGVVTISSSGKSRRFVVDGEGVKCIE